MFPKLGLNAACMLSNGLRCHVDFTPPRRGVNSSRIEYHMSFIPKIRVLARVFAAFRRKDDGTATIEFVLLLPVMILLFGIVADTAMVFGGQAQVLRVVQDANRAMSIGRVRSVEEAQNMILAGIARIAPRARVQTTVTEPDIASKVLVISSTVLIPVTDFTVTGLVDSFTGFDVVVSAQHLSES